MAADVRKNDIVTYKKYITTEEPDAYAEITLKFEGLMESRTLELRNLFNKLTAEIEGMVLEDTSVVADPGKESQPQVEQVLTYKNRRPVYIEREI